MSAYQQLKDYLLEISYLEKASALLEWDMEVMMPVESSADRSKLLATLGAVIHEKKIAPAIGEWLARAESEVSEAVDQRNLAMIRQNYALETQLPKKLVYALEEAKNTAFTAWGAAKASNDWKAVQPALAALVSLSRERAQIHADILGCAVYDAQLFRFARGNSMAVIDPLFDRLKQELPPIVQQIVEKQRALPVRQYHIPVDKQKQIARELAEKIGYSFARGRLDTAIHPFSGGTGQDSRITTRYDADQPFSGFYGVIHEVGHALYSQNLPPEWMGQPIGADSDLSLHESQSLLMEKQMGLSESFMTFLHGLIVTHDSDFSVSCQTEEFMHHLRRVTPSYIRVDADEATYPLHILLRYDLEKRLFAGSLDVADIPEAWNEGFKELVGLDVPEHRLGCMQDIHWFWDLFGYFPTYTQGALYAAQLFAAAKRDLPKLDDQLAHGDNAALLGWLKEKIHSQAQFYDAPELIERATGEKPDARYFLEHLKNRYL